MFESTTRHFVILVVIAVIVLAIGVDIMTLVVVVVVIVVVVVVVVVVIVVVIVVVVVVVVVVVIVVVVVVVVVVVIVVIVIIVIVVVVVVVVVVIIIVVIVVVVIVVIVVVVVVVVVIVVVVIVVVIVIVIVIVIAIVLVFAQEVAPSLAFWGKAKTCLTCSCSSGNCACHRCCLAIACDLSWYWVLVTEKLGCTFVFVLAKAHIPPLGKERIPLIPHETPTIITFDPLACHNLSKARSGHSSGWTPSGWTPSGWCCCRRCLMMSLHLITQVGEILLQTPDNGREMNVQTLDRAFHFCHVIFVCLGCFRVAIFVFLVSFSWRSSCSFASFAW